MTTQPKTRRQFEEAARQAHFARIRHVTDHYGDNLPERTKMLERCEKLYAEDLHRAALDYQAQQRALRSKA